MWIYGDARRHEPARAGLDRLRVALGRLAVLAPGWVRHGALVGALIEAGELAQGIADAEFEARGRRDAAAPATQASMALAMALARSVAASWSSDFGELSLAGVRAALEALAARLPSGMLELRQPEGYAFYALYPESYLAAARPLAAPGWAVIGIRSIGTSLAPMVAVGLGASPPLTLRPVGHPFDRQVAGEPPPGWQPRQVAIVDEGPGLSGSSMAAVARWVREQAPQARLHLFPSHHQGPGAQAGPAVRALWAGTPRQVAGFDAIVLQAPRPAQRLATWVADLVGPLQGPLREIGGGAWRELQPRGSAERPPVHAWQERRKFLAQTAGGRWLVKFAGLGAIGERKLQRARALADAGFSAQPAGLCHGFLVERWRDDLQPLPAVLPGALRERLLQRLADYLGFRAAVFPAAAESGASMQQLWEMARHNSSEAVGVAAAGAWAAWQPALPRLEAVSRRVETDSRLHPWEWLQGGGTLLKTDALDHHAAHDLVGCQDIAWDVAGAAVEFDLDASEAGRLSAAVAQRSGRPVDASLLHFLQACYLAFQLGYWRDAASSASGPDADRLRAHDAWLAARLQQALAAMAARPASP